MHDTNLMDRKVNFEPHNGAGKFETPASSKTRKRVRLFKRLTVIAFVCISGYVVCISLSWRRIFRQEEAALPRSLGVGRDWMAAMPSRHST